MDTTLLRMSRRHPNGSRSWIVPGMANSVELIPRHSFWDAPALSWPHIGPDGSEVRRSVRLDWHRSIAKAEIRKLIGAMRSTLPDFTHLPHAQWAELQAAHYSAQEVNS